MNFNIFRATHGNKKINYHDGMGIREVVQNLSEYANLKTIVIKNFGNILANSEPDEFRYFLMHEEWKRLFLENAENVFEQIDCIYDFENTIHIFPELAHDGYLYLLRSILKDTEDYWYRYLSLPHDILVPMSAIERTSEYQFNIIRDKAHEILDATSNYAEFYDTLYILENYFNIPSEILKTSMDTLLEKEISHWISGKRDSNDTDVLEDFFFSEEAYNLFKDNLWQILNKQGICLYATLIKLVGPDPELLDAQCACPELYPEA